MSSAHSRMWLVAIVLGHTTLGENVLNVGLPSLQRSQTQTLLLISHACAPCACCLVLIVAPGLSLPSWGGTKELGHRIGADGSHWAFLHSRRR